MYPSLKAAPIHQQATLIQQLGATMAAACIDQPKPFLAFHMLGYTNAV
jgi:hypothetical protein